MRSQSGRDEIEETVKSSIWMSRRRPLNARHTKKNGGDESEVHKGDLSWREIRKDGIKHTQSREGRKKKVRGCGWRPRRDGGEQRIKKKESSDGN